MVAGVNKQPFSGRLEAWLKRPGPKTIASLNEVFSEKTFAVAFLLLMFIPALPLPTGGLTHVFEIISMLLALELMVGRRSVWLPRRWTSKELNINARQRAIPIVIKYIRWLERFSRPRLTGLTNNRFSLMLLGIAIFILSLAAFLAPPFSGLDTLPSLGVVLIALALILEDSVLLLAGFLVGALGLATVIGLGALIVNLFKQF